MIEKRRYTGGFYIEHHSYVKSGSEKSVHVVAKDTSGCFQTIDSKKINFNKPKELSLAQSTPVLSCNASIKHLQAQPCNFNHTSSNLKTPSAKELLSNSGHLKHKKSSVHPDAMKSFASGLAAIGILITIIILGLNSLWIVAALVLATLFFGIAAGKLANRAFKDMQYARCSIITPHLPHQHHFPKTMLEKAIRIGLLKEIKIGTVGFFGHDPVEIHAVGQLIPEFIPAIPAEVGTMGAGL